MCMHVPSTLLYCTRRFNVAVISAILAAGAAFNAIPLLAAAVVSTTLATRTSASAAMASVSSGDADADSGTNSARIAPSTSNPRCVQLPLAPPLQLPPLVAALLLF